MVDIKDLPNFPPSSKLNVDFNQEIKEIGKIRSFKKFIGKHHNMKEIMNDVKIGIHPGEDAAFVATLSGAVKRPPMIKKELNPFSFHQLNRGFTINPGRYDPHARDKYLKKEAKAEKKKKKSKKSKRGESDAQNNAQMDKVSAPVPTQPAKKVKEGKPKAQRKIGYQALLNKLKRRKYYCP